MRPLRQLVDMEARRLGMLLAQLPRELAVDEALVAMLTDMSKAGEEEDRQLVEEDKEPEGAQKASLAVSFILPSHWGEGEAGWCSVCAGFLCTAFTCVANPRMNIFAGNGHQIGRIEGAHDYLHARTRCAITLARGHMPLPHRATCSQQLWPFCLCLHSNLVVIAIVDAHVFFMLARGLTVT